MGFVSTAGPAERGTQHSVDNSSARRGALPRIMSRSDRPETAHRYSPARMQEEGRLFEVRRGGAEQRCQSGCRSARLVENSRRKQDYYCTGDRMTCIHKRRKMNTERCSSRDSRQRGSKKTKGKNGSREVFFVVAFWPPLIRSLGLQSNFR